VAEFPDKPYVFLSFSLVKLNSFWSEATHPVIALRAIVDERFYLCDPRCRPAMIAITRAWWDRHCRSPEEGWDNSRHRSTAVRLDPPENCKKRPWSGTDCVAMGTNCFHGLTSAPGIQLFQNSMDVIPYGKLGKIQARGDFLICETLSDESHQLLLTNG